MWSNTEVSRRLGLSAPIIQGPFGSGLSSIDLVVAVSEAGILGSFGVHHLNARGILDVANQIRTRTQRPFALNLWIPLQDSEEPQITDEHFADACELLRPYFDELHLPLPKRPTRFGPRYSEQIEAILEARPKVFSFVYGAPAVEVIRRCRELDIVTIGAATTPAEAALLERSGVDMIVATGFEAGGHRVSFLIEPEDCLTGTLSLVPQVVDIVKVPVIAAGGIADGRGIAAALMLGAQAVQIGTAFLACDESGTTSMHRQELFSERAQRTSLTRSFTGRLARGLHNRFIAETRIHRDRLAHYPVQAWLTAHLKRAAVESGRADLLPLWSGQSAPLLKHRQARELVRALIDETSARFAELG